MKYTETQIKKAKSQYEAMLVYRTVDSYDPQYIGQEVAEQRCEFHNKIVSEILAGNKELQKEWKLFFLNEVVKSERKESESKAKLKANKDASSDILFPIKSLKKIGEFGKWLNTYGNEFRKEHFSKKYTKESVNAFLATL